MALPNIYAAAKADETTNQMISCLIMYVYKYFMIGQFIIVTDDNVLYSIILPTIIPELSPRIFPATQENLLCVILIFIYIMIEMLALLSA